MYEVALIRQMLNELETPLRDLTDWEQRFVEDVTHQFEMGYTLTNRQMSKLTEIYKEKCE